MLSAAYCHSERSEESQVVIPNLIWNPVSAYLSFPRRNAAPAEAGARSRNPVLVYPSFRACLPAVASCEGGTRNPVSVYLSFRACLPAVASCEGGTRNPVSVYLSFPRRRESSFGGTRNPVSVYLSFPRRRESSFGNGCYTFGRPVMSLVESRPKGWNYRAIISTQAVPRKRPNQNRSRAAQAAEPNGGIVTLSFGRLVPPRFCFFCLCRRVSVLVIRWNNKIIFRAACAAAFLFW